MLPEYPADHAVGMEVPDGGSNCDKCAHLAKPQTCDDDEFIAWNGSPKIPVKTRSIAAISSRPKQSRRVGSMAKAFLITHPETQMDKEGRVHGKLDPPLTYSGERHADRIARTFKGKSVSAIHSSPRKRAQQTAQAIAKHTGAKVQTHDELIPWDLSRLSGSKVASMKPLLEWFSNHPEVSVPGGESKNAVLSRYKKFMRTVKGGDVIVGHSQHSLALDHVRKGGNAAKVPMFGGKAGEIREIEV